MRFGKPPVGPNGNSLQSFQTAAGGYGASMKRIAPVAVLLCVVSLLSLTLFAAEPAKAKGKDGEVPSAGIELAKTASQITGIAISPLLGVSAVGAYQWWGAHTPEEKARLPWFSNPMVWLSGLALVGACAFKDAFGATIPPGWKKPFDVMETVENKVSGLVATGAVVPVLVNAASKVMVHGAPAASLDVHLGGLAMVHLGAADFSWLLNIAMVPLSMAVFVIVWLTGHAINALILLSPWGAIDAVLKSMRTAVLGLVTATAYIDPVIGAALSGVIIVFAYFTAGWAFRLMVFASAFCWDFLTLRKKRFRPAPDGNKMFNTGKLAGAPKRTYGRLLKRADGGLQFTFKPWLVLPERTVEVPDASKLVVGRGMFFSMLDGEEASYFFLPPRYRTHEEELVTIYGFGGVREAGLRKAWSWIRETMSGSQQPVAN